jgi:hypothetical protein
MPYAAQASGIGVRYLEDQTFQAIPEADRRDGARDLRTAGYPDATLRAAFYSAMHGRAWFKSRERGRILARALATLGMPEQIRGQIESFIERLRSLIR